MDANAREYNSARLSRSAASHKLIPPEAVVRNADYLKSWVGKDCYQKALALCIFD